MPPPSGKLKQIKIKADVNHHEKLVEQPLLPHMRKRKSSTGNSDRLTKDPKQ